MGIFQRIISEIRTISFFILWVVIHILIFIFGFLQQKNDPSLESLNRVGFSLYTSRGAGLVLAVDCALLLLPVCRTLIVLIAPFVSGKLGIPLNRPSGYHTLIAYTILFFTVIHALAHFNNFSAIERLGMSTALKLHFETWAGVTGHLMLLLMIVIYTFAAKPIRRLCYNMFQLTHHMYIVFFILLFLHPVGCFVKTVGGECKPYMSIRYIAPVLSLFLAERMARIYRAHRKTNLVEAIKHPGGVVELRFDAPWIKFKAGQFVFLQIAALSRHQRHPFTITSAPNQKFISLHIHRIGDWTDSLGVLCVDNRTTNSAKIDMTGERPYPENLPSILPISIQIDGPFGAFTTTLYDHDVAILVGGGIGVTPFASILKDIVWRYKNNNTGRMRRVEFYWVCQSMESFEWFRDELARMEDESLDGFLRVYTHVTDRNTILPSEELDEKLKSLPLRNSLVSYAKTLVYADPVVRTERGRPNFAKIFDNVETEANLYAAMNQLRGKTKVGVFACGPTRLRESILKNTKERGDNSIKFKLFWG